MLKRIEDNSSTYLVILVESINFQGAVVWETRTQETKKLGASFEHWWHINGLSTRATNALQQTFELRRDANWTSDVHRVATCLMHATSTIMHPSINIQCMCNSLDEFTRP